METLSTVPSRANVTRSLFTGEEGELAGVQNFVFNKSVREASLEI